MTEPNPALDKREARARAAADKAYAKSQRSWFARHKILTGVGALFLLIMLFGALGGGDDSGGVDVAAQDTASAENDPAAEEAPAEEAPAEEAPAEEAPAEAQIGTPVRDGKFEFTVMSIEPGPALIGSEDFGHRPQGEFRFVRLKVENVGNEPQTFFGDNQYLYAGERKYSADTEASIYLDDAQSLLEEINPGNAIEGTLVFDVPPGTEPTMLELHDSAFSGGVEVAL